MSEELARQFGFSLTIFLEQKEQEAWERMEVAREQIEFVAANFFEANPEYEQNQLWQFGPYELEFIDGKLKSLQTGSSGRDLKELMRNCDCS